MLNSNYAYFLYARCQPKIPILLLEEETKTLYVRVLRLRQLVLW